MTELKKIIPQVQKKKDQQTKNWHQNGKTINYNHFIDALYICKVYILTFVMYKYNFLSMNSKRYYIVK